jgi:hypothetical protein
MTRAAGARTGAVRTTSPRTTGTARTTSARATSPRTTTRTTTARTATGSRVSKPLPSRPELRLVPGVAPERTRRRLPAAVAHRRAPFVLLVLALLVGTTLGLLVLNTAIAVDSLKVTSLKSANDQRAQEVQRLQREVTTAGTPEQVAADAKKAGLIPAGTAGYLVIGRNGQSTLRGTPVPAAPSAASSSGSAGG